MGYKLYYWPLQGRGEQIRLLLHELDVDYEDIKIKPKEEFLTLKQQGPATLSFASVPMLQDGSFNLVQGPVIMNYLGRKHQIMPDDVQASSRVESYVLGAEDMRMAYFRIFGNDETAKQKQLKFVESDWLQRWLPAWDGLLDLNGNNGYLVGNSLTPADIAAWDVLDTIINFVEGATFEGHNRLTKFHQSIAERPRIASYLATRQ